MLRKSQDEPKQPSTNRNKLPQEQGIRTLAGIKDLLAIAKESRGMQVELEWATDTPGQIFVLDVQWDANMEDPFWALYEQNPEKSRVVWSQTFKANDIEMFYDILVMSCGAVNPSKKLSDILKAQPQKIDWSKTVETKPESSPAETANKLAPAQADNSTKAPEAGTPPNPVVAPTVGAENPNPNPGFATPYGFPLGVGVPMNPAMYPMPAQAMLVPMQYPPMPNAGWPYPPGTVGNNTYGQPSIDPSVQPSVGGVLSSLPIDANLLAKQNDIALVDLLVKAELLTEAVLDAALKIQDLIQANKIDIEKGSEVLKHHHSKGRAIENYLNVSNSLSSSVQNLTPSDKSVKTSNKESPKDDIPKDDIKVKQNSKQTMEAFELLKKAGLLSEDDIKTAQGVVRKHGGDIASVLQAAQKIDQNTLEAAKICQSLEKEGAMKLEQCVIVLNYCIRSRVTFDEAISELNWPNPRQIKK